MDYKELFKEKGYSISDVSAFLRERGTVNLEELLNKLNDLENQMEDSQTAFFNFSDSMTKNIIKIQDIYNNDETVGYSDSQKLEDFRSKLTSLSDKFVVVQHYVRAKELMTEHKKYRDEVQQNIFKLKVGKGQEVYASKVEEGKDIDSLTEQEKSDIVLELLGDLDKCNEGYKNAQDVFNKEQANLNSVLSSFNVVDFKNDLLRNLTDFENSYQNLSFSNANKDKLKEVTFGMRNEIANYSLKNIALKNEYDSLTKRYGIVKDSSFVKKNEPEKKEEITNFSQLINEIIKLNPDVEIRLGNPAVDPLSSERIFSSVAPDKLKLPEGFYYNDKNGITNKHESENGMYMSIRVDDLSLADEERLIPKPINKVVNIPQFVVYNGKSPAINNLQGLNNFNDLVMNQEYEIEDIKLINGLTYYKFKNVDGLFDAVCFDEKAKDLKPAPDLDIPKPKQPDDIKPTPEQKGGKSQGEPAPKKKRGRKVVKAVKNTSLMVARTAGIAGIIGLIVTGAIGPAVIIAAAWVVAKFALEGGAYLALATKRKNKMKAAAKLQRELGKLSPDALEQIRKYLEQIPEEQLEQDLDEEIENDDSLAEEQSEKDKTPEPVFEEPKAELFELDKYRQKFIDEGKIEPSTMTEEEINHRVSELIVEEQSKKSDSIDGDNLSPDDIENIRQKYIEEGKLDPNLTGQELKSRLVDLVCNEFVDSADAETKEKGL